MKNILVVDDDQELLMDVIQLLKEYVKVDHIYTATDPIQGLECFNNHRDEIDTVICDQYMPISHGIDLCRIIKDNNSSIKTIMYTADQTINKDMYKSIDYIVYKSEGIKALVDVIKKDKNEVPKQKPQVNTAKFDHCILDCPLNGISQVGILSKLAEQYLKVYIKKTHEFSIGDFLFVKLKSVWNEGQTPNQEIYKYQLSEINIIHNELWELTLKLSQ